MAAPKFDIHPFQPTEKEGVYDDAVAALIDAGPSQAITLTVPTNEVSKHTRYFQDSAKAHERTAKKVSVTDLGDGMTSLEFTLTDRVRRPRKVENDDAPSESVAA